MRPLSILIVSYYFPPVNMVAALRVYSFAKYLSEYGHKVCVLCNDISNLGMDTSLDMDCTMFETVTVESKITGMKNIDYFYQQALKSDHLLTKGCWMAKNAVIRLLAYIKNRFIGNLFTPEDSWLLAAWRKAVSLDATGQYDVVVTSSGPISCHLVGYGVKCKRKEIVWIADYRDPWLANPNFAQPLWPISRLQAILQKRLNDSTNALITVSEQLMNDFFPEYKSKGCLIENGYFPEDVCVDSRKPDKIVLNYTGTYYVRAYSCRELFEGIKKFVDHGLADRNSIQINFFGSNENSIISEAKIYGLGDIVAIFPKLSRREILTIQRSSSALVFFSSPNELYRGFFSSKLFEYLAAGVPIMVIGNAEHSCAAKLVEEAGAGFVCDCDSDMVFDALVRIRNGDLPERNDKIIESFRRDRLAAKLIDLVEQLCRSDRK